MPAEEEALKKRRSRLARRARRHSQPAGGGCAGWAGRDRAMSRSAATASREVSTAAKQHFEIGEAMGLMDFETAAKISGSRFVVLKGAARPARAGARQIS